MERVPVGAGHGRGEGEGAHGQRRRERQGQEAAVLRGVVVITTWRGHKNILTLSYIVLAYVRTLFQAFYVYDNDGEGEEDSSSSSDAPEESGPWGEWGAEQEGSSPAAGAAGAAPSYWDSPAAPQESKCSRDCGGGVKVEVRQCQDPDQVGHNLIIL